MKRGDKAIFADKFGNAAAAYRRWFWTLVARATSSRPAIRRHSARENASSMAMVAPLADVGRNGCAASPIWMTRPLGDAHCGCGLRHFSFQSKTLFPGVALMSSVTKGSQPSVALRGLLVDVSFTQSSSESSLSSCGICQAGMNDRRLFYCC